MISERADLMTPPGRAASAPDHAPTSRMEFVTTMRGREVRCWLEDGRVCGDAELLRRLTRRGVPDAGLDVVTLARLMGQAVGSEVSLRFRGSPTPPAS